MSILTNAVISLMAVANSGKSLLDLMMTSKFGFTVMAWEYAPMGIIASIFMLFIGGFLFVTSDD